MGSGERMGGVSGQFSPAPLDGTGERIAEAVGRHIALMAYNAESRIESAKAEENTP
jgi:hypothetical protein